MYTAQLPDQGPLSIRHPRGEGVTTEWKTPFKEIKVGTGRKVRSGTDIAVLSIGHIGNIAARGIDALEAEGNSVAHYDMRFVKPIDEMLLNEVFGKFKNVITIEDHAIMGGMCSAVLEFMGDHGYSAQVKRLGIPDKWIEHGTQPELYRECGIDDVAVVEAVKEMLSASAESFGRTMGRRGAICLHNGLRRMIGVTERTGR